MTENEKTYSYGDRNINYLFMEGAQNSPYLVVIFQAIPSTKNNFQKIYGYKKTLNKLNFHRLYIQDTYGLLGCFYLCENMDFSIEEATAMLIKDTMEKYGISPKNVITCGSSKGGTGALYFASKYGLGHAVCGAPPTQVGSFICSVNDETARFMMGDTLPQENVDYLNRIILRHINPDCISDIRILTSVHDKQFQKHMLPLIARAKECNVPMDVTLDDRVKCHHDIAQYFQAFMINNIYDIILKDMNREKPVVTFDRNGLTVEGAGDRGDGVRFRVRIVDNNDTTVLYQEEIEDDYYEFITREIMSGLVYLDLSVNGEEWLNYRVDDVIFDQGYFKYHGYDVEVNQEEKTLRIKINVDEVHNKIRYAYNLSLNREKIVPSFSTDSNEHVFNIDQSGDYRVTFSIRMKDAGKILKRTNTINVNFDEATNNG